MVRLILVFCLAALIGNPVCCCAFAAPVAALPPAEALETLPPCCRARALAENHRLPSKSDEPRAPSCPCSKRSGFVPAEKLLVPAPAPAAPAIIAPNRVSAPVREERPSFSSSRFLPRPAIGAWPPLYLLHRALLC
jgi:hypothetical protein